MDADNVPLYIKYSRFLYCSNTIHGNSQRLVAVPPKMRSSNRNPQSSLPGSTLPGCCSAPLGAVGCGSSMSPLLLCGQQTRMRFTRPSTRLSNPHWLLESRTRCSGVFGSTFSRSARKGQLVMWTHWPRSSLCCGVHAPKLIWAAESGREERGLRCSLTGSRAVQKC